MLCAECAPELDQEVDALNAHDEMLLIRYVELRCNDSFTELYDRYFPVVFRHLRKFIPIANECEDLVQETFARSPVPRATSVADR
jgi:DNA-directed RNA polymerase specialized sigma24 family protein